MTSTLLQSRLVHYQALVGAGLLAALPKREPQRYLYGPMAEHLARMGKGLRPALCLATCGAFGGSEEEALKSAVALEMLHNAFLVHDDVEDGSEFRRAQPTMQAEHGIPLAVNAGDALNMLSLKLVRENLPTLGGPLTWRIIEEFEHLLLQSLEGQAMELGWIRDNDTAITEADYLEMILKKTCWYSFIHPCRIGALIARKDQLDLDRFNRFGYFMGVAFQIQDDVLNLIGDDKHYGKEIAGDLWEGKRTLMLVHLLAHANPNEKQQLQAFLGQTRPERTEGDVSWVLERMQHYGSIAHAQAVSERFVQATLSEFEKAFADAGASEHRQFLSELIGYMIARKV